MASCLRKMAQRLLAALIACTLLAANAAQPPSESLPGASTAFEAAAERLDAALRDRVLVGDDARARFIDAQFARTDPEALVRGLAAAFVREPREILYLASLASACMERTLPVRPECAATAYLAQWSFRDGDNALPWQLLVRCGDSEAQVFRGIESADPRKPARATELAVAIVVDGIATDEATACERQVERLSRAK